MARQPLSGRRPPPAGRPDRQVPAARM